MRTVFGGKGQMKSKDWIFLRKHKSIHGCSRKTKKRVRCSAKLLRGTDKWGEIHHDLFFEGVL
ncbi:hypothetical protein CS562_13815 [Paenibacillus sp. LK1]|nr:hypothetical protein CS562_13815 [Paenibacillus sp. LK1]